MQEKYHIKQRNLPDFDFQVFVIQGWGQAAVGAKLQATNRVPRPVDRGTATRYGG